MTDSGITSSYGVEVAGGYLLAGSRLELRGLALTNANPKYTLPKKPHLSALVVMGTECCIEKEMEPALVVAGRQM